MAGISITVIIGFFGVFLTARFQRKHWLRATREEIRVRETKSAEELVRDIAKVFDKRITAQRFYLLNNSSPDFEIFRENYRDAVSEYLHSLNDIRSRLFYFSDYETVLDFERELHDEVVELSYQISVLDPRSKDYRGKVAEINSGLSVVSAEVYKFCTRFSRDISLGRIDPLKRLEDWRNPANEFIGKWFLVRRLLNI